MNHNSCNNDPNPFIMVIRFIILGLQLVVGFFIFINTSSWILLSIWVLSIVLYASIARKYICARCEGYGKKCYSLYLGLLTSKLYPYSEDKEFSIGGGLFSVFILGMIFIIPFVPILKNFPSIDNHILLIVYCAFSLVNFLFQFFHACRHCAICSTQEWKKICPSNRLASMIWNRKPESF